MTVSVAVNTTSPDVGTTIRVTCSGLTGSVPTAILLNGAGYVSAVLPAAPDGTLTCGRDVPEKVSSQILQVTQYIAGVWTNVGSPITLNVGGIFIPPSPTPPPDPTFAWQGSFAATEAAVPTGSVVVVPSGTYHERPVLNKGGVYWRGASGAKLDFTGLGVPLQAGGLTINGPDIVWDGIELYGSSGAGFQANGPRLQMLNTKSTEHRQEGYAWRKAADHGLIKGGEIGFVNKLAENLSGGEQGAGKTISAGLTLDGVWIHDIGQSHGSNEEGGQGPWWDSVGFTSTDGTVKNCLIERVWYAGIFYEISLVGKFYHNVIVDCGMTPSGSGFWGSGILASAACDVDVYENVFFRNQSHFRLVAWTRTDAPKNADGSQRLSDHIKLHGNVMIEPTLQQFSYGAGTTNRAAIEAYITSVGSGNQVYGNRFYGTLASRWGASSLSTLAGINALPGGGGNAMLSLSDRNAIVAAIGGGGSAATRWAATLAAAGITP